MNLTKMIGQLFLLGFQGETISPDHQIIEDIEKKNLGGVILFERLLAKNLEVNNIVNASQVSKLTSDLQKISGGRLLIAVDQEGGRVCRLAPRKGFPAFPPAAELGKKGDEHLTSLYSKQTAQLLSSLGINFNLAPVVDLNSYPENPIIGKLERSFSSDPDTVIRHARAWVSSHRENGVVSCLKHFPGHGSSHCDSHLGFVDISATWSAEELLPYRELIQAGYADAIMTGHLFNTTLDPRYPATLSINTVDKLLRSELGFKGVVISDDMQMKAITDNYGLEEAIVGALAAGVDMIVIGNNLSYDENILSKSIQAVVRAVDKKSITEETLKLAYQRIQLLKDTCL